MTPKDPLAAAVRAVCSALAATGARFMLIGGLAVIARGVPRQTDDVDATIEAGSLDLGRLVELLEQHGVYGRIPDFESFARERQVLLLEHTASSTPLEVSLAWLPFEHDALARAERLRIGDIEAPIATAEDLIIYKAIAARDQDWWDVERLVERYGPQLDRHRIRTIVGEFAQALEEPERAAKLDQVLGRG